MNDTAIVSCFYTNLHGTKYGGRVSRTHHYLNSLASLLKMTNADFFVYVDPSEEYMLRAFLEPIAKNRVKIFAQDLEDFYMKDIFEKYKNYEEARTSLRCQEIQYLKTFWMNKVENYDYVFWIDAGISYSGLIPDRHLIFPDNGAIEYYNSGLFNNNLIEGMKKIAEDKFLILAINNDYPTFYRHVISDYYNDPVTYHTIGGILGGKTKTVKQFHSLFYQLAKEVIENKKEVHDEECIFNILWHNRPELFAAQKFERWWHEDNIKSIYHGNEEEMEKVKPLKPFYTVLEDLIAIGKQP